MSTDAARIAEMQRDNVDVGALFEPRVNVTFTMAATKAKDVGVVVESKGASTPAQVDAAVLAGATAFAKGHGIALAFQRYNEATLRGESPEPVNVYDYLGK